jgi:hypothetical protein
MRTGRPKQALSLTEEEQDRLQSLAHRARSHYWLGAREWCWHAVKDSTTKPWRGKCVPR